MSPSLPLRPFLAKMDAYKPGEQLDGPRIVKLNTNENPYPPSPAVLTEIRSEAERLHLYPNPTSESLRRALAAYHGVELEQVLVGNGSDEILRLLIHAVVGPGQALGMVNPSYSLYPVLAKAFEGRTNYYPLIDLVRLPEDVFGGPEPIFILPNPNPPVGTLFTKAEIVRLCRERKGRMVVIDEAYVDFAQRDVVSLLVEFKNLVITRTFSKSFSLAGLRVGYLLGSTDLVAELMKIKDSYNMDRLSQVAAAAAVASVESMYRNRDRIVEERDRTAEELIRLGYRVPESHGNFLFAIHPRAAEHYSLLRQRGILVRYFDQEPLREGIRITIGTPEQMRALLAALKEIVG
ncbi:histidinol-phosphate transaminase [bacterium]|nr:histidinol-phosphate transaminase [bacterium]